MQRIESPHILFIKSLFGSAVTSWYLKGFVFMNKIEFRPSPFYLLIFLCAFLENIFFLWKKHIFKKYILHPRAQIKPT